MSFSGSEGWSCGMGRCFKTSVSLHWTFWFNVIFQLIFAVIQFSRSWKYILMILLVWGPFSILTLLFHEMGHIWRTRAYGGSATYTMLWPLGGFNDAHINNGTCLQEFFVAFCGPIIHLPQIFVWMAIMAVSAPNGLNWYGGGFDIRNFENGAGPFFAEVSKRMMDINIMLLVINMIIPAYPLDAANMIAAMAVHCGMSVDSAGILLVIVGGVLGVIAIVYGIISLVGGGGYGLFMLLIGLFVLYTSYSLWKMVSAGIIHQHPIFSADCYKNGNNTRDVEMGNRRSAAPTATPKRSSAPVAKKTKTTKNTSPKKNPPKEKQNAGQKSGPKKSGPQKGRKPRT